MGLPPSQCFGCHRSFGETPRGQPRAYAAVQSPRPRLGRRAGLVLRLFFLSQLTILVIYPLLHPDDVALAAELRYENVFVREGFIVLQVGHDVRQYVIFPHAPIVFAAQLEARAITEAQGMSVACRGHEVTSDSMVGRSDTAIVRYAALQTTVHNARTY